MAQEIESFCCSHGVVAYEEQRSVELLQHTRNAGEFRIPNTPHKADGNYTPTQTIYEFYGYFWRGCMTCCPQRTETHRRLLNRAMDDAYQTLEKRKSLLRSQVTRSATSGNASGVAKRSTFPK